MAKLVSRWEYDGRLFETEEQANHAENMDQLMEYLDLNPLYVSEKGMVESREILLWLRKSCPRVFIQLLPDDYESVSLSGGRPND